MASGEQPVAGEEKKEDVVEETPVKADKEETKEEEVKAEPEEK